MAFIAGPRVVSATGGTISTISGYTVHTFTGNGSFTPSTTGIVEVLVVGGGGGGGAYVPSNIGGGGGGAGAVVYSKFVPVNAGVAHTVFVGAAGLGGPVGPVNATSGGISTFLAASSTTLISFGGGGGASGGTPGTAGSAPLASGGGAGAPPSALPSVSGGIGAGVYGLGFPGGNGSYLSAWLSGSGGGAGAAGTTCPQPISNAATSGGTGVPYTITGTNVIYSYGGPSGDYLVTSQTSYGSGGGAGPYPPANVSGRPGTAGVVIIRYPT